MENALYDGRDESINLLGVALQQELLGQYAAKSGVEIDYETYALVLPE